MNQQYPGGHTPSRREAPPPYGEGAEGTVTVTVTLGTSPFGVWRTSSMRDQRGEGPSPGCGPKLLRRVKGVGQEAPAKSKRSAVSQIPQENALWTLETNQL